jgi:hypothetical protein
MRFIMVNGRTPCTRPICVKCEKPLSVGYLREIGTRLTYCSHECYADHCDIAIHLLERPAGTGQRSRAAERTS